MFRTQPGREPLPPPVAEPEPEPERSPSLRTPPGSPTGKSPAQPPANGRAKNSTPPRDFHVIAPYLEGVASWYGPKFHGKPTANGERYNQNGMTAAHPTLPLGTIVRVQNKENGRVVWVRINDRGPYAKGRILDLSVAAARRLGMYKKGTAQVRIRVLRWPSSVLPEVGLRPFVQYVVQVAAYPEAERAEAHLERIQNRFDWTEFILDWRPGGRLAIVAGPFDKAEDANQVAGRLQKAGVTSLVRRYRK